MSLVFFFTVVPLCFVGAIALIAIGSLGLLGALFSNDPAGPEAVARVGLLRIVAGVLLLCAPVVGAVIAGVRAGWPEDHPPDASWAEVVRDDAALWIVVILLPLCLVLFLLRRRLGFAVAAG